MKNRRIRFSQLAISLGLALFLGSPALAEETEIPWTDWKRMRPSSFSVTIDAAVEQCERSARDSDNDPLTLSVCVTYREMLETNRCEVKQVPDDTGYDLVTGLNRHDQQSLSHNKVKKTGRDDRAIRCKLSETVLLDWFTGVPNQSCNNIGVQFLKSSEAQVKHRVCRMVPIRLNSSNEKLTYLPGFILSNCCPSCTSNTFIPGLLLQSGESSQSTTYVRVCE
ncbi:MAG: hypothetical protein AAB388_00480 [Patescibacteria group bacterium]